jgi:hypothetical protein
VRVAPAPIPNPAAIGSYEVSVPYDPRDNLMNKRNTKAPVTHGGFPFCYGRMMKAAAVMPMTVATKISADSLTRRRSRACNSALVHLHRSWIARCPSCRMCSDLQLGSPASDRSVTPLIAPLAGTNRDEASCFPERPPKAFPAAKSPPPPTPQAWPPLLTPQSSHRARR